MFCLTVNNRYSMMTSGKRKDSICLHNGCDSLRLPLTFEMYLQSIDY